jgi:hypothetical protein
MLYPVERRGRKRVQSSASLYPLIYRHAQQFVESLVASACASPAGPIIHAAQLTKSGSRPARADPISLKGEALSSGRTMDMLEVVGFGFMSLVWVAFVVVTARPRTV